MLQELGEIHFENVLGHVFGNVEEHLSETGKKNGVIQNEKVKQKERKAGTGQLRQ
jgi:hypothetical protein